MSLDLKGINPETLKFFFDKINGQAKHLEQTNKALLKRKTEAKIMRDKLVELGFKGEFDLLLKRI